MDANSSHHGIRRFGVAAALAACAAMALAALAAPHAGGAIQDLRHYEGEATGNDSDSYIEFDAVMGHSRIVKVVRFIYSRVELDCKYNDDTNAGFAFTHAFKVGPLRKFTGTQRVRYGKQVVTAKVRGHFLPNYGAAAGVIRVSSLGDRCTAKWRVDEKVIG